MFLILRMLLKNPPTLILGPGIPEMAHKRNEYVLISKLNEAVEIYKHIIMKWCNG